MLVKNSRVQFLIVQEINRKPIMVSLFNGCLVMDSGCVNLRVVKVQIECDVHVDHEMVMVR